MKNARKNNTNYSQFLILTHIKPKNFKNFKYFFLVIIFSFLQIKRIRLRRDLVLLRKASSSQVEFHRDKNFFKKKKLL